MPTPAPRRRALLWGVALAATVISAGWQRVTGPSYPASGTASLGGIEVRYRLTRTHSTSGDQPVEVAVADPAAVGELRWRRFPTAEPWRSVAMTREGAVLRGILPRQPSSGKLEYQVHLRLGPAQASLPPRPVITRFKDDVDPVVLVTHIACMVAALLLSARAGVGAAVGAPAGGFAVLALGFWVAGGLLLGPAVQKQAFGAWWTGVPFGYDLTDNKTLVAILGWAWAAWRGRLPGRGRWAVVTAALVTFAVFAVPHSLWGSELDWGHQAEPR